jgi:predicted transcriptional regulator
MKKELEQLQEALTQVMKYRMEEPDHEGEMAKSQMLKTMKYAADIMNMIDDTTELPAWVQSKLTKIADYIGAVKHYMESKTVRHVVTNMMEEKEIKLADLVSTPMNEKVNEKQIIKDLESGMSMDAVIGKHANKATTNTGEIRKVIQKHMWNKRMKRESLSPDVAKHMVGIHKGFVKVEGDGTMVYDSPITAKKAADYLNSKKIAASSDGKYLYIESVINEGPSSEELRLAKNAIKAFAKYRRVSDSDAYYDLMSALKSLERQYESVNEARVSIEAASVAHLTGTRNLAVQDFIDAHNLDARKLYKHIKSGSLKDRMEFVTALAGKPGNPIQTKVIKMVGESVTEGKNDKEIKELEAKLKSVKGNTPADQGIRAAIKDDIERLKNESVDE